MLEMPYAARSTQDFSPSSLPGSTRPLRCSIIYKVSKIGNFWELLVFLTSYRMKSLFCSVSVNFNPAPCHCHRNFRCHCYCFHFCYGYCSIGNFSFLCEQPRHCYRKAIKVLSTEKCLPSFFEHSIVVCFHYCYCYKCY